MYLFQFTTWEYFLLLKNWYFKFSFLASQRITHSPISVHMTLHVGRIDMWLTLYPSVFYSPFKIPYIVFSGLFFKINGWTRLINFLIKFCKRSRLFLIFFLSNRYLQMYFNHLVSNELLFFQKPFHQSMTNIPLGKVNLVKNLLKVPKKLFRGDSQHGKSGFRPTGFLTHLFPIHPFSSPWKHQKILRWLETNGLFSVHINWFWKYDIWVPK